MSGPVSLQRETFKLSRAMEFFSDRELTAQIGHSRDNWPVALLKELIDNALDACETAGIDPAIHVELQEHALIVADNGPGLPLATLEKSLDYAVRVSDKTGYVSPSRGQQGNALKTLWAAPFVATGTGLIEVETAAIGKKNCLPETWRPQQLISDFDSFISSTPSVSCERQISPS